jgi:hypothetical protein
VTQHKANAAQDQVISGPELRALADQVDAELRSAADTVVAIIDKVSGGALDALTPAWRHRFTAAAYTALEEAWAARVAS